LIPGELRTPGEVRHARAWEVGKDLALDEAFR